MMTFHEQLRFVGKKNVTILSTHNILTQASTSVWNNSRDHLVDFDWQHMFKRVKKRLNSFDSPIKKSTEAISYATVSKYARYESSSGKMLLTFSLVSTPCLYWDSGKTEEKI